MLALLLVLTACDGTNDDDPGTTSSTGPDTTAPEDANQDTVDVAGPPQDAASERQRRFEAMAACLTDKGFTSEVGSGGLMTEVTEEQQDAYLDANQQCQQEVSAQLGTDPATTVFTEDQLGEQYDALLDVAECLSTAGYPVSDPPSREVWVESALVVQDALQEAQVGENRAMDLPWNPYDDIESVTAAEQCPIPLP